MNIQLSHKEYMKDSNGDIVTIVCRLQGFWDDNTKVYDETWEWNPPYDKRLKELPKEGKQRTGFTEEQMKSLLEADDIMNFWDKSIRESHDYSNHYMQCSRKVMEQPAEPIKIKSL